VLKNLARFLVLALLGVTIPIALPTQALATEEFECSGGTYSINEEGVVSNLYGCTGDLVLDPSARSFLWDIASDGLLSITLPASFSMLDGSAQFWSFSSLTEWKVAPANPNLTAVDGALFSKDLKTLYSYPATKTGSYTAPSTLEIVGAGAFRQSQLTKVDLSENVKSIGSWSFISTKVQELNLSASLTSIEGVAALSLMQKVTISDANPNLKIVDGSVLSADGKSLWLTPASATPAICKVPDGVETIESYSLTSNSCVEITFPDSLKTIKTFALHAASIKKIRIPANVTSIAYLPFAGSSLIEEITVDSSNKNFKAINGSLYNFNISRLIHYPEGSKATEYTLPKTVTALLPDIGNSSKVLNFYVETGSENYLDIDGVIYDIKGETLSGYPGGRTAKYYLLPNSVNKILDGSVVNRYLRLIITKEDPSKIDVTTTGLTVFGPTEGLSQLSSLFDTTTTELKEEILNLDLQLRAEIKQKEEEAKTIQDSLTKVGAALASVHNSGHYRTQRCDGGYMRIDFEGKLWQALDCKGEVNIPSFVDSFDEYALYFNKSITKLNVPASVKTIDSILFGGTTSLTEINVDPKNEKFSSVDGVLFNKDKTRLVLYPSGRAADKYVVPKSVRTINNYAFLGAKVKEVVLPSELEMLGYGAFTRSEIQTITLPKNYSGYFWGATFSQTFKLTSFNVENGNETYASKEGVLLSKNGKSLLSYPLGKSGTSYVVPNGVESIEGYAFESALLTSITLPSTLKSIGYNAFANSRIEQLSIPAGTNILGSYSLLAMKSLKSINVDTANESVTSKDGVIYSKDMRKLIFYPPFLEAKSFTIPSTVKEIDVTAINNTKLLELNFSSDLPTLEYLDLYETKIETVNISASFVSISEYFSNYITSLKLINVDANNPKFSSVDGVLFNKDKTKLIRIPTKNPAKEYVVPATVEAVSENLLQNNDVVTKIVFGPKVALIPGGALAYSKALQVIEVDSANPIYSTRDGILFNKSLTELVAAPIDFQGKSLTLPTTLVTFDSQAYISGLKLETLQIPATLDTLDSWRFNLENLKLVIYDGLDPRVDKNFFIGRKNTPRILTSAELAAEEAKLIQDEKLKSDLKKADESAKSAADARALAEANAKSAAEAKALADSEAKAAKDAQVKAEADAKAAADARAVAEANAKSAVEARAVAEAALSALTAKVTSTITCVKGKKSKKVTGVLPTCPKGYKKK